MVSVAEQAARLFLSLQSVDHIITAYSLRQLIDWEPFKTKSALSLGLIDPPADVGGGFWGNEYEATLLDGTDELYTVCVYLQ